jgi:hypothetical protein
MTIRRTIIAAAAVALAVTFAPSKASAQFHQLELSPTVGYLFGGKLPTSEGELSVPAALSFGAMGSVRLRPGGFLELIYLRQHSELRLRQGGFNEKQSDLHSSYWMIGGRQEAPKQGPATPWASLLFGATHVKPQDTNNAIGDQSIWNFAGMFNAGIKIPLGDRLMAQLLGRIIYTSVWNSSTWWCGIPGGCAVGVNSSGYFQGDFSAALTIPLGGV